MTIRASYFTVGAQNVRPWEQVRPNYLLTVLSTVAAQKPIVSVGESRPATLPRPLDIQFRNLALLYFAQLQVPPVGEISAEAVPAPRLRPRDVLAPNLLATTLGITYAPSAAVWEPDPQSSARRPDFQPPNLAVRVVVAGKPFSTLLFNEQPRPARPADWQFPNLVIAAPSLAVPFTSQFDDRPAAVPTRAEALLPNLLTTTLAVVAAKPSSAPTFERPQSSWKPQDFQSRNIVVTFTPPPVQVPFAQPLGEPAAPRLRPRDFAFPNLALAPPPPAQVPFANQFDDRPRPPTPPWDAAPVNYLVFRPPGVIPPIVPTTGGGEPSQRRPRYTWRWSDFNDRAWLRAFREEFERLKSLRNAKRRRAGLAALEQSFVRGVESVLEIEAPIEAKLDLQYAGEMLLRAAGTQASRDRIEQYLISLAAEIDDEEAFLLLDS